MLAARPLIEWSLEAVAGAASIAAVIVAAPADALPLAEQSLNRLPGELDAELVEGGATRAESVARALERVGTDLVAVHDAARPLVTPELFDAVVDRLAGADDADGAIAAAPIADTVKRADRRRSEGDPPAVEETIDRELLWAAQTPQAFRVAALRAAATAPGSEGATDEAALVESAGGRVVIEPATAGNLKVTTPDDLIVAEALLRSAGRL